MKWKQSGLPFYCFFKLQTKYTWPINFNLWRIRQIIMYKQMHSLLPQKATSVWRRDQGRSPDLATALKLSRSSILMEAEEGEILLLDLPVEYYLLLIGVLFCVFNICPVACSGLSSISPTRKRYLRMSHIWGKVGVKALPLSAQLCVCMKNEQPF